MSLFQNSVSAVAGISRSVPAGGFSVGKSHVSELFLGGRKTLIALLVLDNSSSAAKWFAFQQWETTL